MHRIAGVLALFGLLSCDVVGSQHTSQVTREEGDPKAVTCFGGVGSYKLSRSLLAASIAYDGQEDGAVGPIFKGLAVTHTSDDDHSYCLGYKGSAFSSDIVRFKKTPHETLSLVASRTLDQSRFALTTAFQILFTGVSGSPTADIRAAALPQQTEIKFASEFDPFNYQDTADFNDRANDFGFCVFIPEYAFDLDRALVSEYCDDPQTTANAHPPSWKRLSEKTDDLVEEGTNYPRLEAVTDEDHLRGLLYRPRFAYTVYLMNKQGKDWVVKSRGTAMMENVSPILSVGLERPILAERATALQFDNGALMRVCSYNSAGIAEFVNIPLSIARAIVQLPAQIISVKIGETELDAALIESERRLAETQLQILQLEEGAQLPTAPTAAPVPSAVGAFEQGTPNSFETTSPAERIITSQGELGSGCSPIQRDGVLGPVPVSDVPGFDGDDMKVRAPSVNRN